MDGACVDTIKAFVLHGFPTTNTFTVFLANSSNAFPCSSNIFALTSRRSFLSMPGPLGLAPTKIAASMSLNPSLTSNEGSTPASNL